jgi:hypothetical protein
VCGPADKKNFPSKKTSVTAPMDSAAIMALPIVTTVDESKSQLQTDHRSRSVLRYHPIPLLAKDRNSMTNPAMLEDFM